MLGALTESLPNIGIQLYIVSESASKDPTTFQIDFHPSLFFTEREEQLFGSIQDAPGSGSLLTTTGKLRCNPALQARDSERR